MSRAESTIVGLVIGIICPVSLFVLWWWVAAALSIYRVFSISESGIATAAFTGLGLGIVLDILGLKNWITRFYSLDVKLTVLAYLFWSAMAVAFFMGLPFGNIALGTLAGLYVGRKQHHAGASGDLFARSARNISIFTALVTGAEALPIGILALGERIIVAGLRAIVGLDKFVTTDLMGVGLVGVGCLVLMAVQFWCTRTAAALAFRLGKNVA
ncbi:MAG TPA: hypothetical protein DCP08_00260 [Chloroflexi bacterium]|nr:hypothetical protein [Chloroflexota bacterium]